MGDPMFGADVQMLRCKLVARKHDGPQIDTARGRQLLGRDNIRLKSCVILTIFKAIVVGKRMCPDFLSRRLMDR